MSGYVNVILAGSNFGAIPTIIKAFRAGDTLLAGIVTVAAVSSGLMHISEQKHHLQPVMFGKYTGVLLNIDRVAAYATFAFSAGRWLRAGKPMAPLTAAVFGGILCAIGESVFTGPGDINKYLVVHLIWHLLAYISVGMLV